VAIDLNFFAKKFKEYSDRFGFELYFVDENNIITLSSNNIMKTESHHRQDAITTLNELSWYPSFMKALAKKQNLDAEVLHTTQEGMLISQMPIQELNWRMFIVTPPASQQSEYWKIFVGRFIVFFLISIMFYVVLLNIIGYLKSKLVKDSETDYLTKLPNRSYIHWKFKDIAQENKSLCVVIADIDNFKSVNDTYGHLVGDDVLKVIAQQLTLTLRQMDVTGRWGGEEFVMLLPDTTAEQAHKVVERIRKNIEKIAFPITSTSKSFTTTVSFGICERPLKNATIKDYIAGADKALYEAKNNGRNQTVIFN
jgi:diguanylate cyclase (GGDEF)-like protein